ncbi:MAG: hypothetical protein ACI4NG_01040 [Candidatus Gallimonas sp.]
MIKLYSDEDYWNAVVQRRRILGLFFALCAAYLAFVIAMFAYFVSLPYEDPNQGWVRWTTYGVTAVLICFLFPYMGIKFKRSNSYCKMLRFISVGLKECSVAPFAEIDDWTTRDGVDVNVANFTVRGAKRDETMIRAIYVDGEKEYPPFRPGDTVRFVSQGNLLIAYEILSRVETEHSEENGTEEIVAETVRKTAGETAAEEK